MGVPMGEVLNHATVVKPLQQNKEINNTNSYISKLNDN